MNDSLNDSFWQRIEARLRTAAPLALALLMTLLSALPLGPADLGPVMPFLPGLAVFYWTVYRPDLMPRVAVFALGLLHDGLTGAPLGMTALVLLLLQIVAGRYRRFFVGRTLPVSWLGFGLLASGAAAVSWCVASAYHFIPLPAAAAAAQLGLTVAVYPLFAWGFAALHRGLPSPASARPE